MNSRRPKRCGPQIFRSADATVFALMTRNIAKCSAAAVAVPVGSVERCGCATAGHDGLHWNVTAHPTADWTAQQFRMIVAGDQPQRFVIHDRDSIYSEGVDGTLAAMGLTVLKTPVRAPQANAFCERLVGTIRRECLDFMIPMNERHLRAVLREWVSHYNRGRPHASVGPGLPGCPLLDDAIGRAADHRIPAGYRIAATPILGGLHHEYRLEPMAA